jgi:hypothetical protein
MKRSHAHDAYAVVSTVLSELLLATFDEIDLRVILPKIPGYIVSDTVCNVSTVTYHGMTQRDNIKEPSLLTSIVDE